MWLSIGIALVVLALVALVFHLHTSYVTQCGEIGQVPVLAAAALQVPLLAVLGVSLVGRSVPALDLPVWGYALLWLAMAAVFGGLTVLVGKLARRRQRRG